MRRGRLRSDEVRVLDETATASHRPQTAAASISASQASSHAAERDGEILRHRTCLNAPWAAVFLLALIWGLLASASTVNCTVTGASSGLLLSDCRQPIAPPGANGTTDSGPLDDIALLWAGIGLAAAAGAAWSLLLMALFVVFHQLFLSVIKHPPP